MKAKPDVKPLNAATLRIAWVESSKFTGKIGRVTAIVFPTGRLTGELLSDYEVQKETIQTLYNNAIAQIGSDLSLFEVAEDVTKASDVTISRDDQALDPYFVLEVYSIPNKVNDSVATNNKGQPVLAVLKSVNDADKAELDKYTALIRAQLVQFKQNKTNSMIYLGARDISDIEYNEDGIKLVNQQNNSAE